CPYCKSETNKIHSYHIRKIQDLPICNRKTVLMVTTRKMKCINPDCSHKF
ncbi:MAG: transposase family protein, partial [Lachnospiraceae bacterium]|nr:transposase family protein [Lachnospiraceae bacterium]